MKIIDVQTGEVKATGGDVVLQSAAIGSCIVIAAYDDRKRIGALAHVMMPGSAPESRNGQKARYAEDAIGEMLNRIAALGANRDDIAVYLVGAANVLKRKDDTICVENIKSVNEILDAQNLVIRKKVLGGNLRKSVSLDVKSGTIRYSEGDGAEKVLWKAGEC